MFLLIEDNEDDVFFLKRALAKCAIQEAVRHYSTGPDAEAFFDRVQNGTEEIPRVLLTDVHVPKLELARLLKELKSDPKFHNMPMVILSGSKISPAETEELKPLADDFFIKPSTMGEWLELCHKVLSLQQSFKS